LREDADVFIPAVKGVELALVVLAGDAEEKIGEIRTGFAASEEEITVELRDGVGVDFVVMELDAEPQRVIVEDFGEVVEPLIGIIDLL